MTVEIDPRIPRTILVTGAARRIGRVVATAFGRAGWQVAAHYHHSARDAEETVRLIREAGGQATLFKADLSQEAEIQSLFGRVADTLGPVGCLVNSASTFEYDKADTVTRQGWDGHMEPNLRAPFVLSQHFAAGLPDDRRGAIINMLDQRVWNLTPHFVSYTVSKAALWTLTQTLALSWAPRIRVNAIGPGPVLPSLKQTQQQFEASCEALPLRRCTTPEEIVEAMFFILKAASMTGVMIPLDGGQHLGWAMPATRDPVI